MDKDTGREVLSTINKKGWNLYLRDPSKMVENTINHGPVGKYGELTDFKIFDLFPQVLNPRDPKQIKEFTRRFKINEPTVKVPSVPHTFARAQFSGGDTEEYGLPSGEVVQIQGFCFGDPHPTFVRLIAQERTYMTMKAFLEAIKTLPDISAFGANNVSAVISATVVREITFKPLSGRRFRCNQPPRVIVKAGHTDAYRRARMNK